MQQGATRPADKKHGIVASARKVMLASNFWKGMWVDTHQNSPTTCPGLEACFRET